jgi:hypothetical protein
VFDATRGGLLRVPEDVCAKCSDESREKAREDWMTSRPQLDYLARRWPLKGETENIQNQDEQDQARTACRYELRIVHQK